MMRHLILLATAFLPARPLGDRAGPALVIHAHETELG